MAERVGFEPTVLSHTAFRERHLQPLGHLSARENSRAGTGTGGLRSSVDPSSAEPLSAEGRTKELGGTKLLDGPGLVEKLLGLFAADAAHDLEPARQPPVLGQL